jgi:8-hydroxy-5-deazaflavin:NADPH oxidoreductase
MARIAVLGTGLVGNTLADRLLALGHDVRMGARRGDGSAVTAWADKHGDPSRAGNFSAVAGFGEIVINATAGIHSLDALEIAGEKNLEGKTLIDVANAFVRTDNDVQLRYPPTQSLAEHIQAKFPSTRVVKTLNTVNCEVMAKPSIVAGEHITFVCGNDANAKADAVRLLTQIGWGKTQIIDLGDLTGARATEAYGALWLRLIDVIKTPIFNIALQR